MKTRRRETAPVAIVALVILAAAHPAVAQPPPSPPIPTFTKVQSNYLLNCGGCHGENGVSNSRLVPELKDLVGYYLNSVDGREYLVRLPNVAFSTMTDQELTDVLNFTVFTLGGASAPPHATPFTPEAVARLRKRPLNEVSLVDYRRKLVDQLIEHYHSSAALRVYGTAPNPGL